jgi:uncharacterized protein YggE
MEIGMTRRMELALGAGVVLLLGLALGGGVVALTLGSNNHSADTSTHGVTVQATSAVRVTPDAVRINLTATTLGATSKKALAATATTSNAIRKVLASSGVASKDIATAGLSINPEYAYPQGQPARISGFRASQSLTIVIRKADIAGTVLDHIVAAAGSGATIDNVTPFILDPVMALAGARDSAFAKARANATAYASLLSTHLGKVQYLTEVNPSYSPSPMLFASAARAGVATQIDLGQQDVSVTIEVRWNLK